MPRVATGRGPAIALFEFALALPDRTIVERLVRGRGWIAVVATLLIGLVATQVSLLELNAGIGTAVERSAELERRNGELRAEVSRLSSSERVQEKAIALGMVMPPAGGISYLKADSGAGTAAAVALRDQPFNDPTAAVAAPVAGDTESAVGAREQSAADGLDGGSEGTGESDAEAGAHEHPEPSAAGTTSSTESGSGPATGTIDAGAAAVAPQP